MKINTCHTFRTTPLQPPELEFATQPDWGRGAPPPRRFFPVLPVLTEGNTFCDNQFRD